MTEPFPVIIPLINPNEPGALLAALHVTSGQHVRKGDRLCTLETTKSTLELIAEGDGYLVGLAYQEGQTVQFGDVLCYLSDAPDWIPPRLPITPQEQNQLSPEGLRISQPALALAQQHNLDLSQFSSDVFITETMVQDQINLASLPGSLLQVQDYNPHDIIIYGGGGHGKILIDLIRTLGTYHIAGIVDDGIPLGSNIMGVPVLGGAAILEELLKRSLHLAANAIGGIGNITSRISVFERLARAGFTCPPLVHPAAFVEASSTLAEGVQVMPHAYLGSEAHVGFGVIVNTGAIVSHDCTLGEYTNLSPGAILAGEVSIGSATLIGMGATVNLRVKVGSRARIGNGATVKQDVPEGAIVRAGTVWPP
jgi:acetyltransferase EpsM